MVRLRLKRMGRRHRPFYRLNAVEKRTPRDGKILECLGWYDPLEKNPSKQLSLNEERIKHWIATGAQPTDTVGDILAERNLINADEWKKYRSNRLTKKRAKIIAEKTAAAQAEGAAKSES